MILTHRQLRNPFANKQIAIVGGGFKPNNIFVWHDHNGARTVRDKQFSAIHLVVLVVVLVMRLDKH